MVVLLLNILKNFLMVTRNIICLSSILFSYQCIVLWCFFSFFRKHFAAGKLQEIRASIFASTPTTADPSPTKPEDRLPRSAIYPPLRAPPLEIILQTVPSPIRECSKRDQTAARNDEKHPSGGVPQNFPLPTGAMRSIICRLGNFFC